MLRDRVYSLLEVSLTTHEVVMLLRKFDPGNKGVVDICTQLNTMLNVALLTRVFDNCCVGEVLSRASEVADNQRKSQKRRQAVQRQNRRSRSPAEGRKLPGIVPTKVNIKPERSIWSTSAEKEIVDTVMTKVSSIACDDI